MTLCIRTWVFAVFAILQLYSCRIDTCLYAQASCLNMYFSVLVLQALVLQSESMIRNPQKSTRLSNFLFEHQEIMRIQSIGLWNLLCLSWISGHQWAHEASEALKFLKNLARNLWRRDLDFLTNNFLIYSPAVMALYARVKKHSVGRSAL